MFTGQRSQTGERLFLVACALAVFIPLVLLVFLFIDVISDGIGRLSWQFLSSYPARKAADAGVLPGLVGSLFLTAITAMSALPIGVGAAIYLEEYANGGHNIRREDGVFKYYVVRAWDRVLSPLIEINVANLAGVPSVIYGLLGLEIFVRVMGFGRSVLAGGLTLGLLVLPIVIIASREAIRGIPRHYREAAYGLGATRWEVVWQIVLPSAFPGILTGAILAISRAIGETAPIIVIGALTYITFCPDCLMSDFTALPIQIFNWVSRPQQEFAVNAAAGIIVLLATVLILNAIAITLRNRLQRRL